MVGCRWPIFTDSKCLYCALLAYLRVLSATWHSFGSWYGFSLKDSKINYALLQTLLCLSNLSFFSFLNLFSEDRLIKITKQLMSTCCCSVAKSCPDLWTAACHASLSFTIFWSLLKLVPTESMMSYNHLIPWCPPTPPLNLSQHQVLFQWVSFFSGVWYVKILWITMLYTWN